MTWAVLAALVALAAGMAGFAITAIRATCDSRDDRVAGAKLSAQLQFACAQRDEMASKLGRLASDAEETRARLEAVVAQRDARIRQLEAQLDEVLKDIDPHLLGSSLRDLSLLGRPEEGTTAAHRPAAAAGLPASVATVLDAARGGPGR